MLTRAEKEVIVNQLKGEFEKAQAIFLTNLVGVEANESTKIRKDVRDAKGKIFTARNSFFELAAKGTSYEPLLKSLKGPHAVAVAYSDAAAVAKCLHEKGKVVELVQMKGGVLDGKLLSSKDLQQLANLPSRDQMLATLLATMNAPISAFARVLNAIKESKEGATVEAAV